MSNYRLNDIFTGWKSGVGVFSLMNKEKFPWDDNDISQQYLDLQYHGQHSGNKLVSNFITAFIENGVVSDHDKGMLISVVQARFTTKWTKLYNTMKLEYNPIENYSMTETENVKIMGEINDSTVLTNDLKDINTIQSENVNSNNTSENIEYNIEDTIEKTSTDISNENISMCAFNSSTFSDTDKTVTNVENTGKDITTKKGTEKHINSGDNTNVNNETLESVRTGTETTKKDVTDNSNTERQLTRGGNIGVTTSQQMIESERELWLWDFFEIVFNDVDTLLTLSIY